MESQLIDHEADEIDAVQLSSEEEARIDEALRHATDPRDEEVALTTVFDLPHDRLLVNLKNGQHLSIPRTNLQGLAAVHPAQATDVKIDMLGMALYWPALDIDFLVDDLRRGIYGSRSWMDALDVSFATPDRQTLHD